MSGPKVVRIITREEIIATCQRHMARLDNALKLWEQQLEKLDLISDQYIREMQARRHKIANLLDDEKFLELQTAATAEVAFLEADLEERIAREAERLARVRTSTRRIKATAASLLNSSDFNHANISADLETKLRLIASGDMEDVASANAALNEVFAEMAAHQAENEATLTQKQKILATALGENGPTESFNDWINGAPNKEATINDRIDNYIARLESEYDEESAQPYIDRLARINSTTDPDRMRMLSDTLVLDLATEMARLKELRDLNYELETLDSELAIFDANAIEKVRKIIAGALKTEDKEQKELALTAGRSALEGQQETLAGTARRSAILTELARLGYEVREGMETALTEGNQVVIQKATDRDYGVELVAPPGEKLQVRVVTFGETGTARDAERDRDMEEIWCSEFNDFANTIGKDGGEVTIERSLEAGSTPVKTVSINTVTKDQRPVIVARPKTMTRKAPL